MKPILFNTEMVRKILSGEKTVTRRVVRPRPPEGARLEYSPKHGEALDYATGPYPMPNERVAYKAPYQPGDVLYVRETWTKLFFVDADGYTHYDQPEYYYTADGEPDITLFDGDGFELDDQRIRWRPSIHMPKEAARIFLRVTDVRAERLQESFGDGYGQAERFKLEGITLPEECTICIEAYECPCCSDLDESLPYDEQLGEDSEGGSECGMLDDVRNDFAKLWDSTVAPEKRDTYGWAANPWVWVIEFERCERPKEGRL